METIYVKKIANAHNADGFQYVVPCVSIKGRDSTRLIPHPYGTETTAFDSLEAVLDAVHRAGYAAECEGRHYPPPSRHGARQPAPVPRLKGGDVISRSIEASVPMLLEQLNDAIPSVIASAALSLGEMQVEAAIPGLIHALGNEDATVRKNAAEALAKIGKPGLDAVKAALKDKHWLVRHSALAAIIELIPMNFELVPSLLNNALPLLKDDSWLVRAQAATVFGEAAKAYNKLKEKQQSR